MTDIKTEILTHILEYTQTITTFTAEQIPLIIVELLTWNFWYSLLMFLGSVLWIIVLIICSVKCIKAWTHRNDNGRSDLFSYYSSGIMSDLTSKGLVMVILSVVLGISLFITTMNIAVGGPNMDWLQIKLAPRVYLIEYATDKIQQANNK